MTDAYLNGIVALGVVVAILSFSAMCFRVIRTDSVGILEKRGRFNRLVKGVTMVNPFTSKLVATFDLRPQVSEVTDVSWPFDHGTTKFSFSYTHTFIEDAALGVYYKTRKAMTLTELDKYVGGVIAMEYRHGATSETIGSAAEMCLQNALYHTYPYRVSGLKITILK